MLTEIRQLTDADALAYHELRLRGLREHPEAFTSSFEEESRKPLGWAEKRLAHSSEAPYNFVLGALSDARLIGIVGVSVEPRAKIQHKGTVFGMYVAPEYAGRGVGQRLLTACLERARRIPGLEQLQLTVTEGNARAKTLYEKAGFRAFGLEQNALKIGQQYFHKCHMTLDLRGTRSG